MLPRKLDQLTKENFVNDLRGRSFAGGDDEARSNLAMNLPKVIGEVREVVGTRHFTVITPKGM